MEPTSNRGRGPAPRLGLRQNLAQFMLLVAVIALVGGTLGQERTVLPLLAGQVFHLDLHTSALTYILAFGLAKAATNYFAAPSRTNTAANRSWWQAGSSHSLSRLC